MSLTPLQQYEADLRHHDWSYEYSDDFVVYRRGRSELVLIKQKQITLDPDAKIWNSIAPIDYHIRSFK